jgi:hypothetical protein
MEADIWDGNWRLADHDLVTGRSVWITEQDGQIIARIDMPNDKLEDIFAVNQAFESASQGEKFGDYNRIASIPHHLVYKNGLAEALKQDDQKYINRWMNSSDNRKFRTSRGRV